MLPHHEGKELRKRDILAILEKLDNSLNGIQRKIRLYCLGGTTLMLSDLRDMSKDVDFISSRQDFRAMSGSIAEIERREGIRFDIFPDGILPDYDLKDYELHAKKAQLNFKNIEVYHLDTADIVLTKALAGRAEDYEDIKLLVQSPHEVPKEVLVKRYEKIKPAPDKKEILKSRFEKFVSEFYKT
jgi:hypothetical protein